MAGCLVHFTEMMVYYPKSVSGPLKKEKKGGKPLHTEMTWNSISIWSKESKRKNNQPNMF